VPDGKGGEVDFFVAGHLNLDGSRADGWKLQVVSSGTVPVQGAAAPAVTA
jgi:hypothetical protein